MPTSILCIESFRASRGSITISFCRKAGPRGHPKCFLTETRIHKDERHLLSAYEQCHYVFQYRPCKECLPTFTIDLSQSCTYSKYSIHGGSGIHILVLAKHSPINSRFTSRIDLFFSRIIVETCTRPQNTGKAC